MYRTNILIFNYCCVHLFTWPVYPARGCHEFLRVLQILKIIEYKFCTMAKTNDRINWQLWQNIPHQKWIHCEKYWYLLFTTNVYLWFRPKWKKQGKFPDFVDFIHFSLTSPKYCFPGKFHVYSRQVWCPRLIGISTWISVLFKQLHTAILFRYVLVIIFYSY